MLAVRPESVRFDAPPTDDTNMLDGTVTEATFLGSLVDYLVEIGGDLFLRVQTDRHVVREVGDRVRLTIPVEECPAMPAGETAAS